MVKDTNKRITITISKKLFEWLSSQAQSKDITISKFISWMLGKKAFEIMEYLNLNVSNMEELEEVYKIVKTKWIE